MIHLEKIKKDNEIIFYEMALQYFKELDKNFVPSKEWDLFIKKRRIFKKNEIEFFGIFLKEQLIGFFYY